MRFLFCVTLIWSQVLSVLSAQTLYSHGNPSDIEQYLLELINRARANPAGEESRQGTALNSGLPANTISYAPKQPLAFENHLIVAARQHSADMLARAYFSHVGLNGLSPCARALNAGYTGSVGENIAVTGTSGTYSASSYQIQAKALFDNLYASVDHREYTFTQTYEEIGLGFEVNRSDLFGAGWHNAIVTEKFGGAQGFGGRWTFQCDTDGDGVTETYPYVDQGTFLVGVCYDDINGNQFYDIGEGIPGVTIGIAGGSHYAVSSASGGYAVPIPTSGPVSVTAIGPGIHQTSAFTASDENVKLDFHLGIQSGPAVMKDFDGDGYPGLLWRRSSDGATAVHFYEEEDFVRGRWTTQQVSASARVAGIGDFDGDGKADILWDGSGGTSIHFMNGENYLAPGRWTSAQLAAPWEPVGVGDFDADGKADILYQNSVNRVMAIHYMDAHVVLSQQTTYAVGWDIKGVADFNGDGMADLLLRNSATKATAYHYLNNGSFAGAAAPSQQVASASWDLIGADDFDRNGTADLLWRNELNGRSVIHYYNGTSYSRGRWISSQVTSSSWEPILR